MPINFVAKKNIYENILTYDSSTSGEIVSVDADTFVLKLIFGLELNKSNNNPLKYKKVKVTITTDEQDSNTSIKNISVFDKQTSEVLKKNLNFDKNVNKSIATPGSKIIQKDGLKSEFNASNEISEDAQDLYKKNLDVVNALSNKLGDSNSITSKNIYIDDKVNLALRNPISFMDLALYEFVSLRQEKKFLGEDFVVRDVSDAIISSKRGIGDILTKQNISVDSNLFDKQIADFLIQSNNISSTQLNELDYYTPVPTFGFLNTLYISTDFTLSSNFLGRKLIARIDLFSKEKPFIVEETLKLDIKLDSLLEAYYALNSIDLVQSKKSIDSLTEKISIKVNCSEVDAKKILSYNLYVKNLLSNDKNFTMLRNIFADEEFVDVRGTQEAYCLCYRAIPVTTLGESSIFSDTIIKSSQNYSFVSSTDLLFDVRQIAASNVKIEIQTSIGLTRKLSCIRLYKRNVTNSPNSDYYHFLTYDFDRSDVRNYSFNDSDVIIGNFYEYYAELLDANKIIIKATQPQFCEIRHLNLRSHFVNVDSLIVNDGIIQFNIATQKIKSDSQSSFLEAAASQLSILDQQTISSFDPKDYEEIAYHKVTRIDTLTSDRQTFNIVQDGQFVDSVDTRNISNVSEPIPGRVYRYQIESFKRDPVTISKDFIVTGNERGGWFYRPSKWKNPKVLNTGMLDAENDRSDLELSNADIFLSDFIGSKVIDIDYFTENVELTLSPIASRLSRKIIKISWNQQPDNEQFSLFDCFIVVKCINGKKEIISTASTNYCYHELQDSDIGTVFYEITPIKKDYILGKTEISNSLLILSDLTDKI